MKGVTLVLVVLILSGIQTASYSDRRQTVGFASARPRDGQAGLSLEERGFAQATQSLTMMATSDRAEARESKADRVPDSRFAASFPRLSRNRTGLRPDIKPAARAHPSDNDGKEAVSRRVVEPSKKAKKRAMGEKASRRI